MTDLVYFIGRFHPVVLHLPIGLIVGWIVLEALSIKRRELIADNAMVMAVLTSLSAIVAVATGWLLSEKVSGFNAETLDDHFWLSIGFTLFALVATAAAWWSRRPSCSSVAAKRWAWGSRAVLVLAQAALITAAHHGGSLTHGPDYLSEHAPNWLKPVLSGEHEDEDKRRQYSLSSDSAETQDQSTGQVHGSAESGPDLAAHSADEQPQTVYARLIEPILQRYCAECHMNGKRKGKINFDTQAGLLADIEPGDASFSWLVETLHAPIDDDLHMPPADKAQLNPDEITAIEWWINQGASFDHIWTEDQAPESVRRAAQLQ